MALYKVLVNDNSHYMDITEVTELCQRRSGGRRLQKHR
jgi:hypothetical protein